MKKIFAIALAAVLTMAPLTGCGSSDAPVDEGSGEVTSTFDTTTAISVVSRENGSGTRGAFIELFGIEEKDADGNKVDHTTKEAIITNKTDVMLTNIASNPYAIGYISLGSLSDAISAVQIDGVDATAANVQNGTYAVARPFNIATKADISDLAQDFIGYILSADGQAIIADNGYIAIDDGAGAYTSAGLEGKVAISGSSSVSPVMEKLKEAYIAVNPNVTIEIQTSDSTSGMTDAIEGRCEIGMASRELKDSELTELSGTVIALDGIAIIVNNENPISNLAADTVKSIFVGETLNWDEVA